MLWWGAAAAVPILIFLFARQRFRRVDWAAMDFLLRAFQKQKRRLRVENLLLLILRCAVLILLALAWADPKIEGADAFGGAGDTRQEIVVVLDDSFSTGDREASGETPFRRGHDQALRLVRGLKAARGDTVTVIAAAKPARLLLKRDNNLDRAAGEIDRLELSDAATDLVHAFAYANSALEGFAKGAKVLLFTDLQKAAFFQTAPKAGPVDPPAPATPGRETAAAGAPQPALVAELVALKAAGASVTVIAAPTEDSENLAITDLALTGKYAGVGQSTRVTATVKNFGRRPASGAVNFFTDGAEARVDAQNVEMIPPGATQAVDFRYVFTTPGPHLVEARFVADSLEADNRRLLSLRIADRVRTLIVDGAPGARPDEEESYFVRTALELGSGPNRPSYFASKTVTEVGFDRENLDEFDLVLLLNVQLVSQRRVRELEQFVAKGGGLLLFVGDRVKPAEFNDAFWKAGKGLSPARLGDAVGEVGDREVAFEFTATSLDAPPFDYFKDPRVRAMLGGVPVYRFLDASPDPEDATVRVLGRFESKKAALAAAKPAVLEKQTGAGRVILFATTADRDWNDMAVFPVFVPLIKETAYHLVRRAAARENLLVGDAWRREIDRPVREVIVSRGGRQVQVVRPIAVKGGETFELRLDELDRAGVYRLDYVEPGDSGRAPEPPTTLAVNVDPAESDLARISPTELAAAFPTDALRVAESLDAGESATEGASNDEMWWWVLWAVLAVMVAETVLAQLFGRGRKAAAA
jgi:hypothetical protein